MIVCPTSVSRSSSIGLFSGPICFSHLVGEGVLVKRFMVGDRRLHYTIAPWSVRVLCMTLSRASLPVFTCNSSIAQRSCVALSSPVLSLVSGMEESLL